MKAPIEIGLLKRTQILKLNHDVKPERHTIYPDDIELFNGEDKNKVFLLKAPDEIYKFPELMWNTETETKIRGIYLRLKNQIWISSLNTEATLEETEGGFDSFVLTGEWSFAEDKYWVYLFSEWAEAL